MVKAAGRLAALGGAVAMLALAGQAIAAGNSVRVSVPASIQPKTYYPVTVQGFATARERLYLFIDIYKCAPTPAGEHYGHSAPGTIWFVQGSFRKVNHWVWNSSQPVTDHACVYLQKPSEPTNSPSGVLAYSSTHYHIG